jgi:aryl-alcohol dehydrogenase-like predicted oxidoreductase
MVETGRRVMNTTSNTRRTLLQAGLGLGAGIALWPWSRSLLAANPAIGSALATRAIPSSGEHIPMIGIGTARRYSVGVDDEERTELRAVLDRFARMGGKLIDTAPSYGTAEQVVGDLVADIGNRDKLFLATKVGAGRTSAAAGIEEMEASFKRLRTDRIDLMQVHNLSGVEAMLPVLRDWKAAGRIRYIGISTSFEGQYADFEKVMRNEDLDFIQVDYALDNRGAGERILPLAADRGMAVLVNLPFGRGRVLRAFEDTPLPDWAADYGIASWAQFVLKYVVSHPSVTAAIPGTATLEYLDDNLGAARGPMPDESMRRKMEALIDAG